jgi:glycosyltransferase involved in cell wall biosynthesis
MLQTDLVENVDYKLLDGDMPSVEVVNKIYNASDLFLTTTLGEGWGLSFSEAAATKTPIIAPKSTSFIEMSDNGKRCYLVEILMPTCNLVDNVVRLQCDLYETAEWINYVSNGITGLYDMLNFEQDHKNMKEQAYVWAKSIEWKTICKSWIKHFKETF